MESKIRDRFLSQFGKIFKEKKTRTGEPGFVFGSKKLKRGVLTQSKKSVSAQVTECARRNEELRDLDIVKDSRSIIEIAADVENPRTVLERSPGRFGQKCNFLDSNSNSKITRDCKLFRRRSVNPGGSNARFTHRMLFSSHFDVSSNNDPVFHRSQHAPVRVDTFYSATPQQREDVSQVPSQDSGFYQVVCSNRNLETEEQGQALPVASQRLSQAKSVWSLSSSLSSSEEDTKYKRLVRRTRSQRDLIRRRLLTASERNVGIPEQLMRRQRIEGFHDQRRSQSDELLDWWKAERTGDKRKSILRAEAEMQTTSGRRESASRSSGKIDGSIRIRNSMYVGSIGRTVDTSDAQCLATRAKSTNHIDTGRSCSSHPHLTPLSPPPSLSPPLHMSHHPQREGWVQSPSPACAQLPARYIRYFPPLHGPHTTIGTMDKTGQPLPETVAMETLRHAANCGHLATVHELLTEGATFVKDKDGCTLLHYAAAGGHFEVIELLIARGCVVDAKDKSGGTALHLAASRGHTETVRCLLNASAKIDRQDDQGNMALHEATWNGYSQMVQLLVMRGVNVNVTNKFGCSALHLAAQNGHNQSARVLLFGGCNPNLKNNFGDTALHTAARYGHAGVTRILVSARAKVNQQNKNGDSALHIAAALKRRKIARFLVDAGINCSIKNKQGEKAEDVASRKQFSDILSILSTKTITKKRQSLGQQFMIDSSNGPPQEKKRSKLVMFFSRKRKDKQNGTDASPVKESLQQQLDLDSRMISTLENPESMLERVYLHKMQKKQNRKEPGRATNKNRDFSGSTRLPSDSDLFLGRDAKNFPLEGKGKPQRHKEGRLVQCTSVDTFKERHRIVEDIGGSGRDLYMDSRFNVYYIPTGCEFLEGYVYRSRSDDTLSLGSAHRSRFEEDEEENCCRRNEKSEQSASCRKERKFEEDQRIRSKEAPNNSSKSVKLQAQIEPLPRTCNGLIRIDEILENRSFLEGVNPLAKEDQSTHSHLQIFPSKKCSEPYEGEILMKNGDSDFLDDSDSCEDVRSFREFPVVRPREPVEPGFLNATSRIAPGKCQPWNLMKMRQPLSLYMACTYDDLNPSSNTTSV